MFDIDKWQEIADSLMRHKLRTFLTAFGVGWGIFMLVILLGAGNGLRNGVQHEFRDGATNAIFLWPGEVSKPYKGMPVNRKISLHNRDNDYLKAWIPQVGVTTGRFNVGGEFTVNYGRQTASFRVRGVHPGYQVLEATEITNGRYLNDRDLQERRKVAVIGKLVKERLFADKPAIGEYLLIKNVPYQVVGEFTDTGGEQEMQIIYLPVTTAQLVNNAQDTLHNLALTLDGVSKEEGIAIEKQIKERMASLHQFDSTDPSAIYVWNAMENYYRIIGLMDGINAFVWLVGIGTLFSGIVGVSNIMLIIVKERTKEIGIRKALGATPISIVTMILRESILLTSLAGYMGLLFGVVLLAVVNHLIAEYALDLGFFREPQVNIWAVLAAMGVLVVSGAFAGLFPSWKAAQVQPIVAMRD